MVAAVLTNTGSICFVSHHHFCSSGVSCLQDPERFTQWGSGGVQDSAPVSGWLLPTTGRHEQGHRRVPVQSATLPTIHGDCRLQGQQQDTSPCKWTSVLATPFLTDITRLKTCYNIVLESQDTFRSDYISVINWPQKCCSVQKFFFVSLVVVCFLQGALRRISMKSSLSEVVTWYLWLSQPALLLSNQTISCQGNIELEQT